MIDLPIIAPRFRLRALRAEDAAAIAAYRSDPSTAQWQSWVVPYAPEVAANLIAAQRALAGPTDGEWYTIGIAEAATDELLGDVATHVEWGGRCVEIGYTLRPDARGRGLATEAVGVVVDALISAGAERLRAETHPRNIPSMRVLERLGFVYEGTDRGAYWVGEPPDDEVSDNVRYGMTADERRTWLDRPTGPPAEVRLVELDHANLRDYFDLATHHTERRFVAPVPKSLADALLPPPDDAGEPHVAWFRGIEADGVPAGFVMMAEATPGNPDPYLWRLLIDRRHQRRGIGEAVVRLLVDRYRGLGCARLVVSYVPGPGSPEPFYRRLDFVPTGEMDGDEVVAARSV